MNQKHIYNHVKMYLKTHKTRATDKVCIGVITQLIWSKTQ